MEARNDRQREFSSLRSKRGGVLKSALFLGLFLAAAFSLLWMIALPWAFQLKLEKDTGCSWTAERLACDPFGFELRIYDASLGNAEGFGDERAMMEIRSFRARADMKSLISDEIVVDSASLDIRRMALVLNKRGDLNLEQFVRDLFGESRGRGAGIRFLDCSLKVDTVEILDYSSAQRSHKALRLGVDVDGFEGMGAISLFEPLLEIARRAEYLPDSSKRFGASEVSPSL
ncbi:MAG: hypothetical protein HOA81_17345 [Opitutales bacterium]|nr:hypothetical protein [Opitutales bacterium]